MAATARSMFAHHKLRCTPQRLAIYEALRQCKTHPTVEELFRIVRPKLGRLSLATVYNTLEALSKAGLARRMPAIDGRCRYDADMTDHLHIRLRETAEIRDVPPDLGDRLVESLSQNLLAEIGQRLGVRIDDVSIQLQGSAA